MTSPLPSVLPDSTRLKTTWEDRDDGTTGTDTTNPNVAGATAGGLADQLNKINEDLQALLGIVYASAFKDQTVRLASAPSGNVSGTYANGTAGVGATLTTAAATLTMDGIAVVNGDRVLLKNQTAPAQNGIYLVSGVGTAVILTRTADADTPAKIADTTIYVESGTINSDTTWQQAVSASAITIGTTSIQWKRIMPFHGHGNPRDLWVPGVNHTSWVGQPIIANMPRVMAQGVYTHPISGALQSIIGGITVPAGRTVTAVNFWTIAAGAAPTVDYVVITRASDRVAVARTTNRTSAPTASAIDTRTMAATWTPDEDTPIFVVLGLVNATTARTMLGAAFAGNASTGIITPAIWGTNGVTPTTTVPALGAAVTAPTAAPTTNEPMCWLT